MAGIVWGNLAERLAENIRGNEDIMSGAQLLTTFFLAQSDLQRSSWRSSMDYMTVVLTSVLAEKVAILGITIATNCNPLKLIFAGPDLADIASKANEVANAATDLVKGVALINALTELASDTHEFANAFIGNSEQL